MKGSNEIAQEAFEVPSNVAGRLGEVNELFKCCSQKAWADYRLFAMKKWLMFLIDKGITPIQYGKKDSEAIRGINVTTEEVVTEENKVGHDVKAIANLLQRKLEEKGYPELKGFVQLGISSPDINSCKDAFMMSEIRAIWSNQMTPLISLLKDKGKEYEDILCPAYTMSLPKGTISFGKVLTLWADWLMVTFGKIIFTKKTAKTNGTEGNYAVMQVLFPNVEPRNLEKEFLKKSGLKVCELSEQTCNYNTVAEMLSDIKICNLHMIKIAQDLANYIKLDYLILNSSRESRTGIASPNNTKLDNARMHLKLANGMIDVAVEQLLMYDMQGDMSSSTVMRTMGDLFTYIVNAIQQILSFLQETAPNEQKMKSSLNYNGLIEAVYAVAGMHGIKLGRKAYASFMEDGKLNQSGYEEWVNSLELPEDMKVRLTNLTPSYHG